MTCILCVCATLVATTNACAMWTGDINSNALWCHRNACNATGYYAYIHGMALLCRIENVDDKPLVRKSAVHGLRDCAFFSCSSPLSCPVYPTPLLPSPPHPSPLLASPQVSLVHACAPHMSASEGEFDQAASSCRSLRMWASL